MAKATRAFFGTLSNGVATEAAQREDGKWFRRFYEFNGYTKAWTKWAEFTPSWITESENQYTGEKIAHAAETIMSCGFNRMTEILGTKLSYRLPN